MPFPSETRNDRHVRVYDRRTSVVFLKTHEAFGGLSNMAGGFPLEVNGLRINTSEALYQACRFPHRPEVQRLVIGQASPMTAKMKSKPYRSDSRPDWDQTRVKIMRWCLRVKLAQNWDAFSELLLATGNRPIVEESQRDAFWGAEPMDDQKLVGVNVLGRLLMELRDEIGTLGHGELGRVQPLAIPDFLLAGRPIGEVRGDLTSTYRGVQNGPVVAYAARRASGQPRSKAKQKSPPGQVALSDWLLPEDEHKTVPDREAEGLGPYPAYKDSGVPWLGHVPEHWAVEPARAAFVAKLVKNTGMVERTVLSLSYGRIVVKPEEKLHGLVPESFETYQIVEPGNIVIRATDLQNDQTSLRVGYSGNRGIITSAYMCLGTSSRVSSEFGYQLLNAYDLLKIIYGFGSGLRQNLDFRDLKQMPVLVPPSPEQDAIVRFLDHGDRLIRRYIAGKRKLIALLNEQKQAILQSAVTRGLDSSVRLKSSGLEWLGDFPQHWEIARVKTEFECLDRRRVPLNGPERGAMTTRQYDYYGASGVIDKVEDYLFDDDLLLIAEDGANLVLRNLPLAIIARGKFWVNNHAHILRPRRGNLEYLAAVMESLNYQPWISGAAQPKLTQDRLMSIAIVVPPREEQDRIMAVATAATSSVQGGIDRAWREIGLMREYRTRVIADVVTGKLDVRDAAAHLPEEVDEAELFDGVAEIDESEVEADLDAAATEAQA
jgi:type I restriction enzyme S subunit